MKAVQRFIGLFRDSPTYGRDRANLVSGLTIGTAGLLLNGVVLILILPLMLDSDDRAFISITENLEFGQLMALILLGGAAGFATLLIPLRLVSVFWGPRIGRYFDQVVLSGITPLRYVIGKAISQNLFLGLILFLLLPYLVLSLTLGGVDPITFFACLFLVWLYCMSLAMVTLWASLYMNELLAAGLVICLTTILSILGCMPMPSQPFVFTPFPALLHPVYSSIPYFVGRIPEDFFSVFFSCAAGMSAVIGLSFFAIYLGPLYGLIRDNSTFGEVVRPGDGKRKRWLRLRHHIQRPSEIAFFYENRSRAVQGFEGLIRWGVGFCTMLGLYGGTSWFFLYLMTLLLAPRIGNGSNLWVYDFHVIYLTIHGFGLALCALMFSHTRNSTYLRLPVVFGWKAQVSRLDTTAFLLLWFLFTAMSIATPYYFDHLFALPNGGTVFPEASVQSWRRSIDLVRVAVEGTAVISVAGLAVYALQRYLCLRAWTKTAAFVGVALFYFIVVCMVPLFLSAMFYEMPAFRRYPILVDNAPTLGMCSPFMVMLFLFNGLGENFPRDTSTAPFYAFHGLLIALSLFGMYRQGRKLRQEYLPEPVREAK